MWENYIPSLFVPKNFSDKQVIQCIMDAMERLQKAQVEAANNCADTEPDIGPPLSDFVCFFQGDNAPIDAMGRIKDGDDEGKYDKLVVLIGIFHFFMEWETCA